MVRAKKIIIINNENIKSNTVSLSFKISVSFFLILFDDKVDDILVIN